MKKIKIKSFFSIGVTAGLLILLVICTFFGDRIYQTMTPKVKVCKAKQVIRNDEKYLEVPCTTITPEGELYFLTVEQGFSRTIYRIKKISVEAIEESLCEGYFLVKPELSNGCLAIIEPETVQKLRIGEQVIPKL